MKDHEQGRYFTEAYGDLLGAVQPIIERTMKSPDHLTLLSKDECERIEEPGNRLLRAMHEKQRDWFDEELERRRKPHARRRP